MENKNFFLKYEDRHRDDSGDGFTLIEILIYVAIIGVVINSFISFSIANTNTRNKTYVIQEVQANARVVKELLNREIKEASDIVAPIEGASASVLELDMPGSAENIIYSLSNDTLFRQSGEEEPAAVTSEETMLSDLLFSNITASGNKESIRYDLTIEFRDHDSSFFTFSQNLASGASVRN